MLVENRATKPSGWSGPIWPESAPARVMVLARKSRFLGDFSIGISPYTASIDLSGEYRCVGDSVVKILGPVLGREVVEIGRSWPEKGEAESGSEKRGRDLGRGERRWFPEKETLKKN